MLYIKGASEHCLVHHCNGQRIMKEHIILHITMKKTIALSALSIAAFVLSSCVGAINNRPVGLLYADVADPVAATTGSGTRVGEATSTSYLGLVALGDSSIEAAKAAGHISSVSSVDVKRKNILGIITTYTTTVKGN